MNTWGEGLRLSIFGESHGSAIGIIIDGLPHGEALDPDLIAREMRRRAPGRSALATGRLEEDAVEILSGMKDGVTTGAPLCGVIRNKDARSSDYNAVFRPGHADLSAWLKYKGHADMRGGGHFSGRLTAPLVFAGAIAKQILRRKGVEVFSRIVSIGTVEDVSEASPERLREITALELPVLDGERAEQMKREIVCAKEAGDSVGGVVEVFAFAVPTGLGEPFFGSMESTVSSLFFSVPAVKGVSFGDGFALAGMRGSEANDPVMAVNGVLRTATNHNGGILGGITNGMPLTVRVAIKPTPSIAMEQDSVDADTMRPAKLSVRGRHDPCVVPRAAPVLESCLALCVLERMRAGGEM